MFEILQIAPSPNWTIPLELSQRMMSDDDWRLICGRITKAIQTGNAFRYDIRVTRLNGSLCYVTGYAKPLADANGKSVGICASIQDFTEYKQTEINLRKNEGVITAQNQELIDRNQALETQQQELSALNEALTQQFSGLHEIAQKFQTLYQNLPVACFTCDTDGRIQDWNRACEELIGMSLEEARDRLLWGTLYRPEDIAEGRELHEQVLHGKKIESKEWQVRRTDNTTRHTLYSAFPLRGTDGTVIGTIHACVDITARKRMEAELQRSKERFEVAAQSSKSGLWEWNLQTNEVYLSPQWKGLLGYEDEEFPNTLNAWHERIHPDDFHPLMDALHAYIERRTPEFEKETRLLHRDGDYRWILVRGLAQWDDHDIAYQITGSHTDVTERKRYESKIAEQLIQIQEDALALELQRAELMALNRRLETLATQDGLTGIKNHRAMQEHLEAALQSSLRYGEPLSFMLIDVDNFKQYNDSFGHPAGDDVLRKVARILQTNVRTTDFVARYGGEEFAVIMPHTDMTGATEFADRLRRTIERSPWPQRPITVSIGVSSRNEETLERKQMVYEADMALYASKDAGKNHTFHYAELRSHSLKR